MVTNCKLSLCRLGQGSQHGVPGTPVARRPLGPQVLTFGLRTVDHSDLVPPSRATKVISTSVGFSRPVAMKKSSRMRYGRCQYRT